MNKVTVVTGASRGIGSETALELANDHNTVIAVARSEERLDELQTKTHNGKIIPIAADLTTNEGIERVKEAASTFEALDALINNAGATISKSFMETSLSEFQEMMDVNYMATVQLIQALKPKMRSGSHIVNIASMSGFQGAVKFPGLSAYGASKAAVVGLSEILSKEFFADGIAVNCLCIGAVQTEMLSKAFPGYEAPVSAKQMGKYISNFALTAHQFYNGKILPVSLTDPD